MQQYRRNEEPLELQLSTPKNIEKEHSQHHRSIKLIQRGIDPKREYITNKVDNTNS